MRTFADELHVTEFECQLRRCLDSPVRNAAFCNVDILLIDIDAGEVESIERARGAGRRSTILGTPAYLPLPAHLVEQCAGRFIQ